jgi:molybdate transport system ATP-binding protein
MALSVDFAHPLRSFVATVGLTVRPGETVALVGPSGAGKTTVLRVVAGLLRPREGRVSLGAETWLDTDAGVDVSPERRRVGFLFQEYALFPHLTVEANVAFGASDRRSVGPLLERFGIAALASSRPSDLSGGERQRVALARALAREPDVLLLDEPLSALDAHTRGVVRGELREVLAGLELPTLLVTHDFDDAAALADRVGVVVQGRVLQEGDPADLVARPSDPFVASFTGASVLRGTAARAADGLTEVALDVGGSAWTTDEGTGRVAVAVHPWEVALAREAPDDTAVNHVRAPVASIVTLGNRARVRVGPLTAEVTTASLERLGISEGDVVVASFKATATRLLPLA